MKNITIIGIGLIGSSIARDIREKNKDVIINIVDNSNTALEKSKKLNLGTNYFEKISTFIDKTEIILSARQLVPTNLYLRNLTNLNLVMKQL